MYEVSLVVFVNAHIYVDVQVNAYGICYGYTSCMKWNFMCRHKPYTIETFMFIQVQFLLVPKAKSQTAYLAI